MNLKKKKRVETEVSIEKIFFLALSDITEFLSPPSKLIKGKSIEERFAPSIDRAGVVIITKYGDPIIWPMSVFTGLFWIILFPPQVLPYHLQIISYFLPQYYFFTCVRFVMTGWPITAILPEVLILAAMCGIMLRPGYFAILGALEKANNNGTLSWF